MEFSERYEILEPSPARELRSYRAREVSTGREVLVHVIGLDNKPALRKLAELSVKKRGQIIERIPHSEGLYVVTNLLPGLLFEDWIEPAPDERATIRGFGIATPMPASSPQVRPERAPLHSDQPPSDFTRMFQPVKEQNPAPVAQQGEFTRIFQTPAGTGDIPGRDATPRSVVATPIGENPPSAAPNEPGAFTRLFQTPPVERPVPVVSPPPTAPGDFTRFFQSPIDPKGTAADSAPLPGTPPGEFTRMLQTPPTVTPRSAPPPPEPGSFTRVFGTPGILSEPPRSPTGTSDIGATHVFSSPMPPPTPAPERKSPGEYTRIFGVQQSSPPARADGGKAAAPQVEPFPGQVQLTPAYVQVPQVSATIPQPTLQAPVVTPPVFTPPVVTAPVVTAPVVTLPTVALPQAAAKPKEARPAVNFLPLVVILCLMLVVAVALMIYFATRR